MNQLIGNKRKKYISKITFIFLNDYDGMNMLFSEENKVPRTLFEAIKMAGSAT